MAKIKQTKSELLTHLREQVVFLQRSCEAYDQGHTAEGKRISSILRLLLHDTRSSKSLLGMLRLKKGMAFYDTADDYSPTNILSHAGLCAVKTTVHENDSSTSFVPKFDVNEGVAQASKKFFPEWWNKIVIADQKGNKFTRRTLILAVANKDGGAHVDPFIAQDYRSIARENSMGWYSVVDDNESSVPLVELASIRQIAQEVIMTLQRKRSLFLS